MKILSSKSAVLGLFTLLLVLLTIPTVLLFAQQKKSQKTITPQPTITPQAIMPSQEGGFIAGYVYFDQNNNEERESNENPTPNVLIQITQVNKNNSTADKKIPDITTQVQTDSNGYFKYRFSYSATESTTYVVKLVVPDGYSASTTNPLVLPDLGRSSEKIIEFGIVGTTTPTNIPTIKISPTPIRSTPTKAPTPTCLPRPACLDSSPKCYIAEPAEGWCP